MLDLSPPATPRARRAQVAARVGELIAREGRGPAEAIIEAENDVPAAASDAELAPPDAAPEEAAVTPPPAPEPRKPVVGISSRTFTAGPAQLEVSVELPDGWAEGRAADARADSAHAKFWAGFTAAVDGLEVVAAYRRLKSRLEDAGRRVGEAEAAVADAEAAHRAAVADEADAGRAWREVEKARSKAEGVTRERDQLFALADAALPKALAARKAGVDAYRAARDAELDGAEECVLTEVLDALVKVCAAHRNIESQRRLLRAACEGLGELLE
jgi:hypothetical protein